MAPDELFPNLISREESGISPNILAEIASASNLHSPPLVYRCSLMSAYFGFLSAKAVNAFLSPTWRHGIGEDESNPTKPQKSTA